MSLFWRELGHIFVWFVVAETCQYFTLSWFPEWAGGLAILFSTILLCFATIRAEWREYEEDDQPTAKTVWDIIAKLSGIGLAVAFPGVWENFL